MPARTKRAEQIPCRPMKIRYQNRSRELTVISFISPRSLRKGTNTSMQYNVSMGFVRHSFSLLSQTMVRAITTRPAIQAKRPKVTEAAAIADKQPGHRKDEALHSRRVDAVGSRARRSGRRPHWTRNPSPIKLPRIVRKVEGSRIGHWPGTS